MWDSDPLYPGGTWGYGRGQGGLSLTPSYPILSPGLGVMVILASLVGKNKVIRLRWVSGQLRVTGSLYPTQERRAILLPCIWGSQV